MTVELVQENRIEPEKADTPRIPWKNAFEGYEESVDSRSMKWNKYMVAFLLHIEKRYTPLGHHMASPSSWYSFSCRGPSRMKRFGKFGLSLSSD